MCVPFDPCQLDHMIHPTQIRPDIFYGLSLHTRNAEHRIILIQNKCVTSSIFPTLSTPPVSDRPTLPELGGQQQPPASQKVEYVTEHLPVSFNEKALSEHDPAGLLDVG